MMRSALTFVSILLLAACGGGGTVTDSPPPTPPDTTTNPGPGTVQRGSIAVVVSVDPADAALASAADISPAGLTVTLTQVGRPDVTRSAVTDASGAAVFDALLQGQYEAGVTRTLTAAELQRLPAADREASVFAGGTTLNVTPGQRASGSIALVGARRGSLVVSEYFLYRTDPAYISGDYLEVYNNSDTTIYLDGLMLLQSPSGLSDHDLTSCDMTQAFRSDPALFWVQFGWTFPGVGREYPILPGEGKVIAMDALNHAAAAGRDDYPDLSRAHFEQYLTTADIDNPIAANMIPLDSMGTGAFGRGYPNQNNVSWAIALPTTQSAWVRRAYSGRTTPFYGSTPRTITATGAPASSILDIFSVAATPELTARLRESRGDPQIGPCSPFMTPPLERDAALLADYVTPRGVRRKSLGRTPQGREILQRTRNSARDLELGPPLKRSLNR